VAARGDENRLVGIDDQDTAQILTTRIAELEKRLPDIYSEATVHSSVTVVVYLHEF
jgi:hypothetical protein